MIFTIGTMAIKRKTTSRRRTARAAKPAEQKSGFASLHPGIPPIPQLADHFRLPDEFVASIEALEKVMGMPVWFLVQDGQDDPSNPYADDFNMIGHATASAFFKARHSFLEKGQRIALVIDSGGGKANAAYEIAMLLRRHCGGFVAVVPRRAKSAATLLTLGADRILMNDNAELGPLDVQIWDPEREETISGLDEVQSLERLQAFAMEAADRMMIMLLRRTGKKNEKSNSTGYGICGEVDAAHV